MMKSLLRQAAIAVAAVSLGLVFTGMVPVAARHADRAPEAVEVAAIAPAASADDACARATWPYFPAECLTTADGSPAVKVRWITIETRVGADTSVLMRTRLPD